MVVFTKQPFVPVTPVMEIGGEQQFHFCKRIFNWKPQADPIARHIRPFLPQSPSACFTIKALG